VFKSLETKIAPMGRRFWRVAPNCHCPDTLRILSRTGPTVDSFDYLLQLFEMITKAPQHSVPEATMRLDKWLWAARFFKTRQLAIDAINGGKVHVNGQRTKPGKSICTGTQLSITKEPFVWDLEVRRLDHQRRSAELAVSLYEELPESLEKRLAEAQKRREDHAQGGGLDQRPNKRERRLIHRFKRLEPPG